MSSTDDSAWKDAVRPKVISGPVPSTVNTIINNSGLWQPGMTLFNYEDYQQRSLLESGMVTVPGNKNTTNYSSSIVDQTGDTTTVMKQQLQQSAENAKNDSTVNQNDSTINQVDAFQIIRNNNIYDFILLICISTLIYNLINVKKINSCNTTIILLITILLYLGF